MCDEWMTTIPLPLTIDQFRQLPRNPAYKYEFLDGQTYLTPRPKYFHAVLDLRPEESAAAERVRPLWEGDWEALVPVFAAAFRYVQPFGSLDDERRREAAHKSLNHTRTGGDGPRVDAASFVALDDSDRPAGAILITLLPDGDPCDCNTYYWREPPPPDLLERRGGRPHLTWVFVAPLAARHGVGSALLAASARALLELGYRELLTTFLLGNDASMLWHWRNGFRLLEHPFSQRGLLRRTRRWLS